MSSFKKPKLATTCPETVLDPTDRIAKTVGQLKLRACFWAVKANEQEGKIAETRQNKEGYTSGKERLVTDLCGPTAPAGRLPDTKTSWQHRAQAVN